MKIRFSGTSGFKPLMVYISILCCLIFKPAAIIAQLSPITVMSFNIRYDNPSDGINSWDNRKELVIQTFHNNLPDIIGMQEVLEGQLAFLDQNLPGYNSLGVGRDDGKTGGEYVPVFYKTDRFNLIDQGTFWLSPTPNVIGSVGWDAALTRICTWVRFSDTITGLEFYFLNTHFDHVGKTARTESAKLILDFIQKEIKGLPVILTGDFNFSPEEVPFGILTNKDTGMHNICSPVDSSGMHYKGTFNGFVNDKSSRRIDMVFCKGMWEARSYEVLKIKEGEMFISDHWPVIASLENQLSTVGGQRSTISYRDDTTFVQTYTFDSIVTRRAVFNFPEKENLYEKILMYYTLKCDSLTPHDKYPCGEWDYTTYTRVYHPTGKMDSVKHSQPSFTVKRKSPKSYLYSNSPTYTYYEYYEAGMRGSGEADYFASFQGADYISVPGEAFRGIKDEITVSFWLNGDPFYQPMASTIFEGLDAQGKRVINLHIPYDNGVVYWDAGGRGEGLTDNIYKAAAPRDYKGRWTHWTVTKNSRTGEQKIYLDGKLFQKGNDLKRTMDGISTFKIGSNGLGDDRFYRGSIDNFALWSRELDSLQIESLPVMDPKDLPQDKLRFCFIFDDVSNIPAIPDISVNSFQGKSFGNPAFPGFSQAPHAIMKPHPGQIHLTDSVMNPLVSIVMYSDSIHPQSPTDTLTVWPGYNYYCNSQGIIIDSSMAENANTLSRRTWIYYSEPSEIVESYEIGRFITPYGKRLDLGLNGFTWVYDVTDYEPLLHGKVDLQAANGQELLDLKFLFIEGIPPRDVIALRNIWPEGSHTYKELADDEELQTTSFKLQAEAESFMLRARISGHGHNGPFNCCEWDPKMHTFVVDNEKKFDWKVWRDCGMNPVNPQGGTWQFDRAGWCPGTFVDTYDFEITPYVKPGTTATIDYTIQPYDLDNGEEGGSYEMAMHLFEYSAPNYRLDLELTDIMSPSRRQEYLRMNPVTLNPVVRVRNTGSDTIRRFSIQYGLEGGKSSHYEWTGKLSFMESADIILPKPSWHKMTAESIFIAEIIDVNDSGDENKRNNTLRSEVRNPVILPGKFYIHIKTQGFGRAADNAYKVTNEKGVVVYERTVFEDDSTYHDLIKLKPGAYDLTFTDKNEDGMIRHWWLYWEDKEKVGDNGELKILDSDKNEIMNLGYDFAEKRTLQLFVGEPW